MKTTQKNIKNCVAQKIATGPERARAGNAVGPALAPPGMPVGQPLQHSLVGEGNTRLWCLPRIRHAWWHRTSRPRPHGAHAVALKGEATTAHPAHASVFTLIKFVRDVFESNALGSKKFISAIPV